MQEGEITPAYYIEGGGKKRAASDREREEEDLMVWEEKKTLYENYYPKSQKKDLLEKKKKKELYMWLGFVCWQKTREGGGHTSHKMRERKSFMHVEKGETIMEKNQEGISGKKRRKRGRGLRFSRGVRRGKLHDRTPAAENMV